MKLSINDLLTSFADDKLIAPKVLEKKLAPSDPADLRQLQIALDALERIGILIKERGKYRRVTEEGVVEGKLRCSSKGFCFAIQDQEDTEDIYIRESQLNTAWNGDRVLVKVTKEGRRRRSPEGEVRLILERANPSVIARVKQTEAGDYRAVPLDDRLLFELELTPNEADTKLADAIDQLVHAEIVRYPLGQNPPLGKITRVLGSDAQSAADTELVFCKYDLPRAFDDAVIKAADALPRKLRKADQKNRIPLQDVLTLAISGVNSHPSGLDHAFSLEQTTEGNWFLGVHISDVSNYIPINSTLDQAARKRGATICLGDTVLPLFPEGLINRVGALSPGVDRLAISVLITLNPTGEVVEFEVQPSVIHVDHQLNDQQVQTILDPDHTSTPNVQLGQDHLLVADALQQMQQLSRALQQQRYKRGSFDLHLPQADAPLSGDEGVLGVVIDVDAGPGPRMVAEFLTLTNHLVVTHLQALGVPAVYRIQSQPDIQDIQDLIKLVENLGLPVTLGQEDMVQPQDFQALTQAFQKSEVAPILFELLKATLKPVKHSTIPGPHFGLAHVQNYGHFSASLNRYGDLLNHRVLHAVFDKGRDRRNTRAKERVNLRHSSCHGQINWNVLPPDVQRDLEAAITTAVPHLNDCEQLARQAEQDLVGLQKTKKMQAHTGDILQGIITGIQSYGFFVRIESLMAEGLVHVSSLKDDWYEYRARQQTLIGRKNRRQYRLGDRVEVEVKSVDYYRQQIDLAVVGGGSEASEEDLNLAADLPDAAEDSKLVAESSLELQDAEDTEETDE